MSLFLSSRFRLDLFFDCHSTIQSVRPWLLNPDFFCAIACPANSMANGPPTRTPLLEVNVLPLSLLTVREGGTMCVSSCSSVGDPLVNKSSRHSFILFLYR